MPCWDLYEPVADEAPDPQSKWARSEGGDMRANRLPDTASLHEHVSVLIAARHGPTLVSSLESRSAGYDCSVAIDPDVDVIALATLKVDVICLDRREAFRLVSHVPERIGQDVFIGH